MDFHIFLSVLCGLCNVLRFILIKIWKRWTLVEIFLHPETGRLYTVKTRKGRYRFYVNFIRVPKKIYNWL